MQECFISSIFNLQSLFLFDEFGDWFGDVIVWRLAFERYLIFWSEFWSLSWKVRHLFKIWWCWWWKLTSLSRLYFIGPCKVETVQDFLTKLDIKPLKYGFHKKYFQKSQTLTSWTLFSPVFFQISADWLKLQHLQIL